MRSPAPSFSETPPAIVLGGSWNAVSLARSLGSRGIPVYALADRPERPVRRSRYCSAFLAAPPGEDVQASWLDWLCSGRAPGAVVLPAGDDGLELIARHRSELVEAGHRVIEADDHVVLEMLDKDRQYELAAELGVAAPRTVTVRSEEDLELGAQSFSYPCALKPLHSHVWARHFTTKVVVAHTADELRAAFAQMQALGIEMLVTEIIPGGEDQYFGYYSYLDEHGQPLLHLTKQKIRQLPPGFGLGCYHVTNWDPEVAEAGLRFMQGVGVRGLANVEFKRDARDGSLKLIELNYRFTAINELLRIAGMDLALVTYNRLTGRPLPRVDGYRRGVRLWYPIEDTRAAMAARRSGDLTVSSWVRSVLHRQHMPLMSLADPLPSLAHTGWLVQREVRKRIRRRRSGDGGSGARHPSPSSDSDHRGRWAAPAPAAGSRVLH